jgi:hypothetical protein
MIVIDSHFHIYKDKRAGESAQGNKKRAGFSGTIKEAIAILNRNRIERIVALAVLPVDLMRKSAQKKWPQDLSASEREDRSFELETKLFDRITRYNDFLCRAHIDDERITPFIAADSTVDTDKMVTEILDKRKRYGIKGIKIHPEANRVFPYDDGYRAVFEIAQQNDLIVISHGGLSRYKENYCDPQHFCKVLDDFPKLKLIVAHFGYPQVKPLIEMASRYANLYTDTSYLISNGLLFGEELGGAIRDFGVDRVLYGSDFPWVNPEKDANKLVELGLQNDALEKIAHKNAAKLFGWG